jgi:hypothetical protein
MNRVNKIVTEIFQLAKIIAIIDHVLEDLDQVRVIQPVVLVCLIKVGLLEFNIYKIMESKMYYKISLLGKELKGRQVMKHLFQRKSLRNGKKNSGVSLSNIFFTN